ncbi:MAG: hypothetical protein KIT81_13430 [Alphaproteobacteria bacterium]|nr:hypothetical protein [Alphaproteobacteria bacterium]
MILGRILGWLFAALALLQLGGDLLDLVASGTFTPEPLGQVLYELHAPSLNLAQALVQRYLHPAIWDPGIQTVLLWPAFLCLGLIAALLLVLFRRRAPRRRRGMFRN